MVRFFLRSKHRSDLYCWTPCHPGRCPVSNRLQNRVIACQPFGVGLQQHPARVLLEANPGEHTNGNQLRNSDFRSGSSGSCSTHQLYGWAGGRKLLGRHDRHANLVCNGKTHCIRSLNRLWRFSNTRPRVYWKIASSPKQSIP